MSPQSPPPFLSISKLRCCLQTESQVHSLKSILKSINKAVQEDCGGMNLKAYKEQRKRNFLKSMYGIGGRRGSQAMPSDVNTLIRTSLENRL